MSSHSNKEATSTKVDEVSEKGLLPEHLQTHVTKAYEEVKVSVQHLLEKGLNSARVLELTDATMRVVGKIKGLVGYEKKVVVLSVVGKFVEETAKDMYEKVDELSDATIKELEELHVMVKHAVSPYIDQVYALAPEVYGKAKKRLEKVKAFFKKIVPCK